jgi:hypothetical protein
MSLEELKLELQKYVASRQGWIERQQELLQALEGGKHQVAVHDGHIAQIQSWITRLTELDEGIDKAEAEVTRLLAG